MKKKNLVKALRYFGWYFDREGGRHEIWTNGKIEEAVPRHREINELLARKIIKRASEYPGRR